MCMSIKPTSVYLPVDSAFRRGPKADDAYALSVDNYLEELSKFSPYVNEVHSVGVASRMDC